MSSVRLLLTVTCAVCFITLAIASADAKSINDRAPIKPKGVTQSTSPTVREHSGGPPPRDAGTVHCRANGACYQNRDGRPVRVYPVKRDHRTPEPRGGGKK